MEYNNYLPISLSTPSRSANGAGSDMEKASPAIKSAAEDFEAMFLKEMLQQMFSDKESNELDGDPETDNIYQSMMVEQYGKIIARAGGIGVADYVTRTMLQMQEAQK